MSGQSISGDWLMSAVKQNPEGLLLLAAGAVLLMRKGGTLGRALGGERFGRAGDAVTKATAGATDYISEVTDRAKETVGSVASSASGLVEDARHAVAEGSDRVMRQAHSTYQGAMDRVLRDQPLLIAVAGAAAGVAFAAAFPSSNIEKRTLGPIGAKVTEAASEVGGQLKEAAGKAGETLKDAADERGLNREGLKKVASEVADAFSSNITGESPQRSSQTDSPAHAARANSGNKG